MDFGEAAVEVGGRPLQFVKQTTEACLDRHVSALSLPGGFRDRFCTIARRPWFYGQSLKAPGFRQRDGRFTSR